VVGPEIDEGVEGKRLKLRLVAVPDPQEFTALAVIDPLLKFDGKLTVMLVPLLAVMLQPVGTVQM
jgi:hypothetical protein